VLLAAGSPVPDRWQGAAVVAASATSEPSVVDRLHEAWRRRERLVIEWTGPLPPADPTRNDPFHQLSPAGDLPGERLRFAVTANAVNLLESRPTFEPISLAVAAGARPGGSGDVTSTEGDALLVDGGPLAQHSLDALGGLPVVPRVHLVAGVLLPLRTDAPGPGADLAPDQLEAVAHDGGPARIIAPAGSGKTRVLTERTRHLVLDRGVAAAAVSLVAYNRRARVEMADRLTDVPGLDIRTLNSLALAIATNSGPFATAGKKRSLTTISELDARRLLDKVVPGRRRRQLTDPLEPWIDALSACRLGLRDPTEIESAYGGDVAGFPDVLDSYRTELRRRGELDFDEQILAAVEVLMTDPAIRDVARRAAPILLIDEFQDLTPAHLLLIRLLAGPAQEVVAVGDDDQTIYGYSGASPEWLVDFDRFFPGAADHPLTVNYRCPPEVVTAAANLLSHNRYRVAKTITAPARSTVEAGVEPLAVNDADEPQQRLVDHVGELVASGAEPDDIAVLARVNAALLPATIYLAEAGVPVARPIGVDRSMLERSGVGAALSWLRLATAPAQRLRADDLRMAVRRPPRSLHPRIADWVCEQRSVKDLYALAGRLNKEREAQIVTELAADIEQLRERADGGAAAVELLDEIYHTIGLLGAASQLDQSQRTARRAAHADELAAIRALAAIGPDADQLEAWIANHLDRLPRNDDPERGSAVTLATIHSTKGLEWPHVVVHDVRGDLHPHRLATDTEEERRIFHVALTRCRRSVLINAHPAAAGPPRSPFVAELQAPREQPHDEPDGPRWPQRSVGPAQVPKKSEKTIRSEPSSPAAAGLRQSLTEWRTERCKADGVPAYIVLGNATLDAIAESAPGSLVALGRIKGIGPAKLDRYGADILGIVADAAPADA
jgi:DNA helicase-2/ATP-dependent DNA helicase PcrA